MMIKYFVVLGVFFGSFNSYGFGEKGKFFTANNHFHKGELDEAISIYEKILEDGYIHSSLQFNLAIAHYRKNSVGLSLFHLREALKLSPRDPDILYNYSFISNLKKDKIEDKRSIFSKPMFLWLPLSISEIKGILVIGFLGWVFFTAIKLKFWNKYCRVGEGISILIVVFGCSLIVLNSLTEEKYGILKVETAMVYSGKGKLDLEIFELSEGSEFIVEEGISNDEWLKIKLYDGKKGWLKNINTKNNI